MTGGAVFLSWKQHEIPKCHRMSSSTYIRGSERNCVVSLLGSGVNLFLSFLCFFPCFFVVHWLLLLVLCLLWVCLPNGCMQPSLCHFPRQVFDIFISCFAGRLLKVFGSCDFFLRWCPYSCSCYVPDCWYTSIPIYPDPSRLPAVSHFSNPPWKQQTIDIYRSYRWLIAWVGNIENGSFFTAGTLFENQRMIVFQGRWEAIHCRKKAWQMERDHRRSEWHVSKKGTSTSKNHVLTMFFLVYSKLFFTLYYADDLVGQKPFTAYMPILLGTRFSPALKKQLFDHLKVHKSIRSFY